MPKPNILLVYPYIEDFAAYDHFAKPVGLWMIADMLADQANIWYINALDRSIPELHLTLKPDGTGHFFQQVLPTPPQLSDIPRRWKRYGMPEHLFLRKLGQLPEKPDWIFVSSGMTYWYTGLHYTLSLLREKFPHARIALGGIYTSLLPDHAQTLGGDIVIPFQHPAQVATALSRILNLSIQKTDIVPDYTIAGEYAYAPLLLSMGCVFKCHYCASPRLLSFLPLSKERTIAAFQWLYEEKKVRHFAFYDDALLVHPEDRLIPLLTFSLEKGYECSFHTPNGLHIRFLTEDLARLMKKAGFIDVRLSLESSDEVFQKTQGQKAKNDEFLRAIEMLFKAGFERKHIRVYTLANVPGQTLSSVEKTMDFIYASGALPMLAYYSPIPGTPDFKLSQAITDLSDPLFHNNTVYLYRSGIDIQYLQYLHQKEVAYRHKEEPSSPPQPL
ncbi:B12-binding domain-containing radical SAM protein [Thermospira aquatica]|uniref:Radical SAM protein n=1 Tax=Thermospira aquatica TaxID=2828656 RepID=A0AAX3BDE4_9SPIR|nr:radical SAM protein [Thermospira aquatica]URA10295.1 radical SAM protein [Thermospira aquatica]